MIVGGHARVGTGPGGLLLCYESCFDVEYLFLTKVCAGHVRRSVSFLVEKVIHKKSLILFMVSNLRERCTCSDRWKWLSIRCDGERIAQYHTIIKLSQLTTRINAKFSGELVRLIHGRLRKHRNIHRHNR